MFLGLVELSMKRDIEFRYINLHDHHKDGLVKGGKTYSRT
jgi:hypothetical protein